MFRFGAHQLFQLFLDNLTITIQVFFSGNNFHG